LWIRIFPDKPITRRPAETRIGSGKGTLEYWVAVIRSGVVIFEVWGISEIVSRQAMRITSSKLPVNTRFVKSLKDHYDSTTNTLGSIR
jgi:large subunit ribosomal protein L16